MKNNLYTYLIGVASFSMMSCAPVISTSVKQNYPINVVAQQVRVYNLEDSVPEGYSKIGTVRVEHSPGLYSIKYNEAIVFAQQETSRSGGDAFAVTDVDGPKFSKKCQSISGDILLGDKYVMNGEGRATHSRIVNSSDRSKKRISTNSLNLRLGYGYIPTELLLADGIDPQLHATFNYGFGYDYISKIGLGFGINLSGLNSTNLVYDERVNFFQHYIAFHLLYQFKLHEKWVLGFRYGLGPSFFNFSTAYNRDKRVGIGSDLGIDVFYQFHPKLAVGLQMQVLSTYYNKPNASTVPYRYTYDEKDVVGHTNSSLSLRYFF